MKAKQKADKILRMGKYKHMIYIQHMILYTRLTSLLFACPLVECDFQRSLDEYKNLYLKREIF